MTLPLVLILKKTMNFTCWSRTMLFARRGDQTLRVTARDFADYLLRVCGILLMIVRISAVVCFSTIGVTSVVVRPMRKSPAWIRVQPSEIR